MVDEANLLIYKLSSMLSCEAKENYTSPHELTGAGGDSNPSKKKKASTTGQKKRRLTLIEVTSKGESVMKTNTMNFTWAGTVSFQHM